MGNSKINVKILKDIETNCNDDKLLSDFLKELLYEEAGHPGQWWWNSLYRKKIEEYCNTEE